MPKIAPRGLVGGRAANTGDVGVNLGPIASALNDAANYVQQSDNIRRSALVSASVASAAQELSEFSFYLKNGSQADDGSLTAPPPAAQHQQLYQQRVKEINERNKNMFGDDEGTYGAYESNFQKFALKESFSVREHASVVMRSEANANLEKAIETFADVAAGSDSVGRSLINNRVKEDIDRNVAIGALTPEQGFEKLNKYQSMLTRADVISGVRSDPTRTALGLLNGDFKTLSPEERQRWIDTAIGESDKQLREQMASVDRARVEQERAQKILETETAKTGFELDIGKKLSVDWVAANRNKLAEDDYKYLLNRASGTGRGAAEKSNVAAYAELREQAGRGVDVRQQAKAELFNGELSINDYTRIVGEVEENSVPGQLPTWYKRGVEYLQTALKTSDVNPNPAALQLQATVLDDFRDWADAHPNATHAEAQKTYREMAVDGNLLNYNKLSIALPKPRYLHGSRTSPDLEASWLNTKKAYAAGELDAFEYKKQAQLINEWRKALETSGVKSDK